jgi:hypothetical protein
MGGGVGRLKKQSRDTNRERKYPRAAVEMLGNLDTGQGGARRRMHVF